MEAFLFLKNPPCENTVWVLAFDSTNQGSKPTGKIAITEIQKDVVNKLDLLA